MLEIELMATTDGTHHLLFGMNSDSLSSFGIQMWITRYGSRAIDWIERLSLGWVTFMGGDLWVHNQPESLVARANFYGEQKDVYVGVVANENPNVTKLLDSIGIHTDGEWEVTSVTIPKSLNYPNGMRSRIPINRFKRREGVYRAEFLRNMNTTSSTDSVLELMNGEPLRAECAYIILKNTQTTQVKLYMVDINMTSSNI